MEEYLTCVVSDNEGGYWTMAIPASAILFAFESDGLIYEIFANGLKYKELSGPNGKKIRIRDLDAHSVGEFWLRAAAENLTDCGKSYTADDPAVKIAELERTIRKYEAQLARLRNAFDS